MADHAGVPQPGVLIQTNSGLTTTTTATGHYTITGVTGGEHLLTPSLSGFRFSPSSHLVLVGPSQEGQDFIVFPAPQIISFTGDITLTLRFTDTQHLTTTLTFPAGAVTDTVTLALTPTLMTLDSPYLMTTGHNFELAC